MKVYIVYSPEREGWCSIGNGLDPQDKKLCGVRYSKRIKGVCLCKGDVAGVFLNKNDAEEMRQSFDDKTARWDEH